MSVTNDLTYDQRVHKVCLSLKELNFDVLLVGRFLKDSSLLERPYAIKRFHLLFKKGFLFYAFYNIRLFVFLLFKKVDVLHANDLDTLFANWLISRIRKKEIIYDSHEYFTGVPEIQHRPLVKKTWEKIEKLIFPKLKNVFTVNQSIADIYKNKYNVEVKVLRNLPFKNIIEKTQTKQSLKLPLNKSIIILQGAGINIDRGAEELLEAIAISDNLFLCIVGSGDVIEILKKRSCSEDLRNKVLFTGKLNYSDMMQYTMNSTVGVSLDKDTNINYRLSLPNKIFDYVKADIPVVCSNLIEVAAIVNQFQIGLISPSHDPEDILNTINKLIDSNEQNQYKPNLHKAMEVLNWENEVKVLINTYSELG